jgi:hypothetical protein
MQMANFSLSGPTVDIHADKDNYSPNDDMQVYVGLSNPGASFPAIIRTAVLFDGNPTYDVVDEIPYTVPAGANIVNYKLYDYPSGTLSGLPSGNHAWLIGLFSPDDRLLHWDIDYWSLANTLTNADKTRLKEIARELITSMGSDDCEDKSFLSRAPKIDPSVYPRGKLITTWGSLKNKY